MSNQRSAACAALSSWLPGSPLRWRLTLGWCGRGAGRVQSCSPSHGPFPGLSQAACCQWGRFRRCWVLRPCRPGGCCAALNRRGAGASPADLSSPCTARNEEVTSLFLALSPSCFSFLPRNAELCRRGCRTSTAAFGSGAGRLHHPRQRQAGAAASWPVPVPGSSGGAVG